MASSFLAVQRVDGAEPLGKAAAVFSECAYLLKELLHLDDGDGLLLEEKQMLLVPQLHRMVVIARHAPRERAGSQTDGCPFVTIDVFTRKIFLGFEIKSCFFATSLFYMQM